MSLVVFNLEVYGQQRRWATLLPEVRDRVQQFGSTIAYKEAVHFKTTGKIHALHVPCVVVECDRPNQTMKVRREDQPDRFYECDLQTEQWELLPPL